MIKLIFSLLAFVSVRSAAGVACDTQQIAQFTDMATKLQIAQCAAAAGIIDTTTLNQNLAKLCTLPECQNFVNNIVSASAALPDCDVNFMGTALSKTKFPEYIAQCKKTDAPPTNASTLPLPQTSSTPTEPAVSPISVQDIPQATEECEFPEPMVLSPDATSEPSIPTVKNNNAVNTTAALPSTSSAAGADQSTKLRSQAFGTTISATLALTLISFFVLIH